MRAWLLVGTLLFGLASDSKAQDKSAQIHRHYQRAREALAQHDLEKASQSYAEILALDPQNVEVLTAQGMTLYSMGKPAEATAALERALTLDSGQATAELFLGLSKSDLGQCSEAAPLLHKHLKEQTERKLRRLVGLSLLNCQIISNTDEAINTAHNLRNWYPDDPDVLYHLASIYSQLWNRTVAELLKKSPESFRVHQLAGEALETQGRNDQAVREYLKALEINPKLPRVHYRVGRLILAEGNEEQAKLRALEHFKKELAINPGDAACEYELGEIFRKSHEFEAATQHYVRALQLSSDLVDARVGLAKVYSAAHQPQRALKELELAVRQDSQHGGAHYALMLVYRDLGRAEDAERESAIFQSLENKKRSDFKTLLDSLLTGKPSR
jgi:tetratricopeptide (TPR) repeat protein